MPCEKPVKRWTGLWRTQHPCSRRVPSIQDRVCAKCHMEQQHLLIRPPPCHAGDPESELTAALARLPPRYVGVKPRPRDFDASPLPSPRPSRMGGLLFATTRKEKKKKKKGGREIAVIATHQLSQNTAERDLEDLGFGGTSYYQPPVEDQKPPRFKPHKPSDLSWRHLPSVTQEEHIYSVSSSLHKSQATMPPRPSMHTQAKPAADGPSSSSSSSSHRHPTRPDSPVPRPMEQTMANTAAWVEHTSGYAPHERGDAQGASPGWAGPPQASLELRAHPVWSQPSSHLKHRGEAAYPSPSHTPVNNRSGWDSQTGTTDSPTYNTVNGPRLQMQMQILGRPQGRTSSYRGVTFS